jgi:prepilin-type N-terminal cleavage/methylation domain-containing protein
MKSRLPSDELGANAVARRAATGFTLIEIMVVVVLLSVIVLGLMAMFGQVQRAFRAGTTQSDILEGGRMATEMISRELEQITPSYANASSTPLNPKFDQPNFFIGFVTDFEQPLPASSSLRTNIQDDVFFLIHENQTWTGIGYFVRSNENLSTPMVAGAVGTLYRFEKSLSAAQFSQAPGLLFSYFDQTRSGFDTNNYSKILDGVISFKLRAFDREGNWMNYYYLSTKPNSFGMWTNGNIIVTPTDGTLVAGEEASTLLYSNAVPAFVEFELGVIEQGAYERYQSIPIYLQQTNYLAHQIGRVHLFRQRVAVRNVDPSAY